MATTSQLATPTVLVPPAPISLAERRPAPSRAGDTLASLLAEARVPWETLQARYGSLLELVHALIGVVPNCDRYLEIWEPAFRSYNVLVPNLLNVPFSIFGVRSAPAGVVGMGMYVASRTAECPYCTAHSCSFALRRGASPEKMARAFVGGETFSPGELATVAAARSLARIPSELTSAEREALARCYSPDQAEWIVLGIVMMGFLNKFMNAIGVELEPTTFAETAAIMGSGWSPGAAGRNLDPAARSRPPKADTLRTKLRIVPHMPAALRLDTAWLRGVPGTWPEAGAFLRDAAGHDFPVLGKLRHGRAVKSIAAALRDNLDPATTVTGLPVKALAAAIFAETVADRELADAARALAVRQGVTQAQIEAAARFASDPEAAAPGDDSCTRALLLLARAASPSPAAIDAGIVTTCRDAGIPAPAIVELVTWLAVLQMLHRLISYFAPEPVPAS